MIEVGSGVSGRFRQSASCHASSEHCVMCFIISMTLAGRSGVERRHLNAPMAANDNVRDGTDTARACSRGTAIAATDGSACRTAGVPERRLAYVACLSPTIAIAARPKRTSHDCASASYQSRCESQACAQAYLQVLCCQA